jgi:Antitoxin SocA-like, Panacea domain
VFEREKFSELIVYIAERTATDRWFGDMHVNKALYWSDFNAYRDLGHPITGARYFKLPLGPAAKPLLPVRDELVEAGDVEIDEPAAGTKLARKTLPRRKADTRLFLPEELELIDAVIDDLSGKTAGAISAESHEQSVGWQLMEMYDDIPYRTALISDDMPSADTMSAGRAAFSRHRAA